MQPKLIEVLEDVVYNLCTSPTEKKHVHLHHSLWDVQWNFDIMKGQGQTKFVRFYKVLLYWGSFYIYFTISGVKKIVCYTKDFVI